MPLVKPSRGLQLNTAHPLARGLILCPLFNEMTGSRVQDLSSNRAMGSLVGNTAWSACRFGSGLKFDGTGDYASFAAKDWMVPGIVTVLAWICPTIVEEANRYVVSKGSSYFLDAMRSWSDYPHFYIDVTAATSNKKLTAGAWNQLVGTYDGAVIRVYVDGRQTGSISYTTGIPGSSENLYVAVNEWTTGGFDGHISHVMIWKRALSDGEIALLYREPFCMFERPVSRGFLLAPSGQVVSLAGTSAASTDVTASLRLTYRCAAMVDAQAGVDGSLIVAGEVLLAGVLNALSNLTATLAWPYGGQGFAGSLKIERDWLLAALFGGMTANTFKLGTVLALGWFWMRRSGCSTLYRGWSMEQVDFANVLAVAEQDATEISPPGYVPHSSDSTYFYVVRRFNSCGYQERTLAASVEVSIDADGNLKKPGPNDIFGLNAEQVDGNKIQLVWFYCPLQQESKPVCFKVYYDGGTGQIDYESPIAVISYQGRKSYDYRTGDLQAGKYSFAVRAEDVGGMQDASCSVLTIQLATEVPQGPEILSAESV